MALDTIHHLHEIAQRCLTGQPLEDNLARWLGGLLEGFLSHRFDSLEHAMGLTQDRGGVPWWLELAIRRRDAALRSLARDFFGDAPVSVQAKRVQVLAVRYAASSWRGDRLLDVVPARYLGTPHELLWQAFHSGARMPIGERQLRSILRPADPSAHANDLVPKGATP